MPSSADIIVSNQPTTRFRVSLEGHPDQELTMYYVPMESYRNILRQKNHHVFTLSELDGYVNHRTVYPIHFTAYETGISDSVVVGDIGRAQGTESRVTSQKQITQAKHLAKESNKQGYKTQADVDHVYGEVMSKVFPTLTQRAAENLSQADKDTARHLEMGHLNTWMNEKPSVHEPPQPWLKTLTDTLYKKSNGGIRTRRKSRKRKSRR